MSKLKIKVELNEEDLNYIIKDHIEKEYGYEVGDMRFITGTRGNYDRGTAKEYVKKVYIELNKKDAKESST